MADGIQTVVIGPTAVNDLGFQPFPILGMGELALPIGPTVTAPSPCDERDALETLHHQTTSGLLVTGCTSLGITNV